MEDTESADLSRRQMLESLAVTAGITGLAGCFSVDQVGASDVKIYNAAGEPKSIFVTITASESEEPHTSRALDVGSAEMIDPVNESKLPLNSNYRIEVAVENGPSETFEWEDPTVERAPLFVFIDDTWNIKFLLQAG